MKKIKLVLVDDQKLVREGLTMILSLCEDFEIVGEASNGWCRGYKRDKKEISRN